MRIPRPLVLTLSALCALVATVSTGPDAGPRDAIAQDAPPAPPQQDPPPAPGQDAPPAEKPPEDAAPPAPPAADPDAPTDAEDAAARAIVEAAAKRQGGDTLAPPTGRLDSFRMVFHKVTVHRLKQNEDGTQTRQRIDSETPGLVIAWKGGQIRTEWYFSSETPVVRGVMHRTKPDGTVVDFAWLHDGTAVKSLANAGYERDLAEVERDRKIVKAMLDAAVLRTMLNDGSRWKVVEDATFEGTALRRTPPAGAATPLRLTIWVDGKTADVNGARLAPNAADESTMFYGFTYVDGIPRVKGDVLRFPARFRVMEQRPGESAPADVMDATASEASFNDVADEEFKPPRK